MQLACVTLPRKVSWVVTSDDPELLSLEGLGWNLLNPSRYSILESLPGGDHAHGCFSVAIGQQRVLIHSSALWLSPESSGNTEDLLPDLFGMMQRFLPRLRFASKQATLPQAPSMLSIMEIAQIPGPPVAAPEPARAMVRRISYDWAVRLKHVHQAAGEWAKSEVPLYHNLMLDAVEAAADGNHRSAILYAAIAVETAATTILDATYQSLLSGSPSSDEHRFRDYPVGKGDVVRKDAVFTMLRDRDQFASLIHEQPLYLLGRSLALEDQSTYQAALRLYRTRNKIAHIGEPPGEEKYFPLTEPGTRMALDAAFATLYWLDDERGYVNPVGSPLVDIRALRGDAE